MTGNESVQIEEKLSKSIRDGIEKIAMARRGKSTLSQASISVDMLGELLKTVLAIEVDVLKKDIDWFVENEKHYKIERLQGIIYPKNDELSFK
jgi:hypothetical protein